MPRWILVALAILAVALAYAGYRLGQSPARPNVVFILLDTLRADRVGAERNGIPITPFLSSFAQGGTAFSNAISPSSWTKPAMASLFTAVHPETHRVWFSVEKGDTQSTSDVLSENFETLAEYLQGAGYDTWGFQTNANGGAAYGFGQGFDAGRYAEIGFVAAESVTNAALDNLPEMKPPFFLFTQYIDPHAPYTEGRDYEARFGKVPGLTPEDEALLARKDGAFWEFFYDDVNTWLGRQSAPRLPRLSEAGREVLRARYDAEIRAMDDEVARLVRTIEGKHKNTIFVFVSDHGEEFWERGTMGHGHTLYQELVHVPLILRGPGVPAGVVERPVETLGILPTLAKLIGLPARPHWQAGDLLDPAQPARAVHTATKGSFATENVRAEAVIEGDKKLIEDTRPAGAGLFDLRADPAEKQDLRAASTAEAARLAGLIEAHRETTASQAGAAAAPALLSAEAQAQLAALGYLSGEEEQQPAPAPDAAPPAPRNVLLVVVDTLRGDRVAARRNGVAVMPQTRALAERGVWFQAAYTQASWTKPSVVSILTSLYPETHRVQFGIQAKWLDEHDLGHLEGIPAGKETAPLYFKRFGYSTAVVQTNKHLQAQYGFGQGCDQYEEITWAPGEMVTAAALKQLDGLAPPFFLYAHYFDPHASYDPPQPHRDAFGPLPEFTQQERTLLEDPNYHQNYYLDSVLHNVGKRSERKHGEISETGRERVRMLYDGECHYADAATERLIAEVLRRHPDTIVVYTSDHGEEFWEHGSIGHAKTVYEEAVHVPLIFAGAVPGGKVVDTRVQSIDILPTLAALLGLPPNEHWQGRDLSPAFHGAPLAAQPVFSSTRGSLPELGLNRRMVIEGADKLVQDLALNREEYFNLGDDPGEQHDLGPGDTREALQSLLAAHEAAISNHPMAAIAPSIHGLDEDTKAELESLGYLDKTTSAEGEKAPAP